MRLLDEVATFAVHPARVNLSRVNEPFLDSNLFSYLDYASRILPKTELVLFSNGQALTDAVIDRLNALPMFRRLTISCNESDPVRYREVMGLDWDKTQPRIANLHQRYQAGTVRFDVSLSRVGTSTEADKAFLAWAKEVYPEFPAASHARFDWVGKETEGDAKRQLSFAPDAGCVQWFSLHILSDGNSAFGRGGGNAGLYPSLGGLPDFQGLEGDVGSVDRSAGLNVADIVRQRCHDLLRSNSRGPKVHDIVPNPRTRI